MYHRQIDPGYNNEGAASVSYPGFGEYIEIDHGVEEYPDYVEYSLYEVEQLIDALKAALTEARLVMGA